MVWEEYLFISGFLAFFFFFKKGQTKAFECIYRYIILKRWLPSSFWINDWDYDNHFEMSLLIWKWRNLKSYLVRVNYRQKQRGSIPGKWTAGGSEIAMVRLPISPKPKLWDYKLSNTSVTKRRVVSYYLIFGTAIFPRSNTDWDFQCFPVLWVCVAGFW